ncbi:MAG: hypothetical protein K2Y27_15550 [Xanthobacteraceae bacterium]|nr:hypothetical protein [Xanthobacteraceae bacterium]
MAKSRKKARKAAKRKAGRRKTVKAKARRPAKKTRRAKRRRQVSIVDAVAGAVRETGELRSRLAGHNTFED